MFKALLIVASVLGANAFVPAGRVARSSSAMKMAFEEEIGVLAPLGFFDPLGLCSDGDEVVFARRRAVELKHGRVAMLAVSGYVVAEIARFPGAVTLDGLQFKDVPNGLAAITAIPAFGWFQIAASIGFWEIFGWKQQEDKNPGDFGFGGAFFGEELEGEKLIEKQTKELQNGRLAMIAIMELMRHDSQMVAGSGEHLITGLPFLYP
mmetsp:Transcript_18805/g.18121  ORF Transcript_18805/g.18121 Transcript_18805/m.18121 type:complete len:207 (-) Transcript_18805:243-863(-)|eukprot:CAMPEP_0119037710 /NCGR_PEP_ID=MMETSP1177-20130426/6200_1 /TAXON_ID=2985 /ORGANISM="Ochromonas sp, Strain CCMP1899" /LENGTH=206 /DNA_ID=CAMNT_0006999331 /DNA_START=41 /DNA_END=661 /DNA_ORIENTATION=-